MVSIPRPIRFGLFVTLLATVPIPAMAGPARYDKATRSFRFTYTFAALPSASPGAVVGQVQKPTREQTDTVNALVSEVSRILEVVTEGRAKIGQLDYVDTIKDADLVISLVGAPASPGFANLSAIEGAPGQIVLYYQSLVPMIRQDVVLTAAHEICHYVFGLADEYDQGRFPGGCPTRGGPGCLMDNYHPSARGFLGRLCGHDSHNSTAAQRESCQDIVEKFFNSRGVGKSAPGDQPSPSQVRQTLLATVVGEVRHDRQEQIAAGKATSPTGAAFVRKKLEELINSFNAEKGEKVVFSASEFNRSIDLIRRSADLVYASRPDQLEERIWQRIRAEARTLGERFAKESSDSTRVSRIRTELGSFVAGLFKAEGIDSKVLPAPVQRQIVEQLSRQEGRSAEEKRLDQVVGGQNIDLRIGHENLVNTVAILKELNAPGVPRFVDTLREIDQELTRFGIPGRTADRFGMRRTRFINPDPELDQEAVGGPFFVHSQAGVFPYASIRQRAFQDFTGLINREKIELVEDTAQRDIYGGERVDGIDDLTNTNTMRRIRSRRNGSLQALIDDLYQQLKRDRLENIVIFVPPVGMPPGVAQSLQTLRAKLKGSIDVRVDVVLVGPAKIPPELRDLAISTRGSVLLVADADEIGAVAQRIKNEQTSGAWVIIPQQGRIANPPSRKELGLSEADKLALDRTRAIALSAGIRPVLEQASDRLDGLRRDVATQNLRDQVNNVLSRVDFIKRTLIDLDADIKGDEFIQPAMVENNPSAVTAKVRRNIGLLRLSLNFGRDALYQAKALQGASEPSRNFLDLAAMLEAPDALGPNLTRLEGLIETYEDCLEHALNINKDYVPIHLRIDRENQTKLREQLEAESVGRPHSPIDVRFQDTAFAANRIRLARFHAEDDSDFELVVGLSRPLLSDKGPIKAAPEIELYDDSGAPADDGGKLIADVSRSSDTLYVYKAEVPRRLKSGFYTPVLNLEPDVMRHARDSKIQYTFSVGSERPNIELIANLIQAPNETHKGTVRRTENEVAIEVQVIAGSPVLNARVSAFYQKIVGGAKPIVSRRIELRDDGRIFRPANPINHELRDRAANDGIYTGTISISDANDDTEYRVFIQAETTADSRYIALDNAFDPDSSKHPADKTPEEAKQAAEADKKILIGVDTKTKVESQADTAAAQGKAMIFQRATSIHFHVPKS